METPLEYIIEELLKCVNKQESVEDNLRIIEIVREELRPGHLEHLKLLRETK